MTYEPTTTSAIAFEQVGRLEEWIHLFLCNEGNNQAFSDGLRLQPREYHAPRMMKLDLFERCCGPEDGLKYQIPASDFRKNIRAIAKKFKTGNWDMPPLIINHMDGKYELNDGNHRFEALQKLGAHEYWVIIWETTEA